MYIYFVERQRTLCVISSISEYLICVRMMAGMRKIKMNELKLFSFFFSIRVCVSFFSPEQHQQKFS